jgi:hypothetical protein
MFQGKFNSSRPLFFYFILICVREKSVSMTCQMQISILIAPWNK